MNENKSEIARLLQQIGQEYEAAQRGMSGFAQVSPHEMITARMENMGRLHEQLLEKVGVQQAAKLVADHLNSLP